MKYALKVNAYCKVCIIMLSFYFTQVNAQKAKYDSLQHALFTHTKEDATRLTLLNELAEICALTILNKFDSGIICADKAIALAKKLTDNTAFVKAHTSKAEILTRKGNYNEADSLLKVAVALNTKLKNNNGLGDCYMVTSLLHGVQGDFEACKTDAVKALELYNSKQYKFGIANANMFIGYINKYTGINDTAVIYFTKADSIFLAIGNEYKPAFVYVDIAHMYVNSGRTKEAMNYLLHAQQYYEKDKNLPGLAMVYAQIATVYNNLNDDKMEMEYILKGLRISEQMNRIGDQAYYMEKLGSKLSHLNEYTAALQYFQKAVLLAKSVNASEKGINGLEAVVMSYNGIGDIKLHYDEPKKALAYYDSALSAAQKLKFPGRIAESYNNIGDAFRRDSNYANAISNYRLALTQAEKVNDHIETTNALNALGKIIPITPANTLRNAGIDPSQKCTLAEGYLLRSLELANKDRILLNKRNALLQISRLYEQQGNTRKALQYLHEYTDLQDTIIDSEKAKAVISQQIQFETEKKEQEIISLNKDKALREQQLENQKLIRNASIGGIVLLLILIAVLVNRYKLKRSIAMERMQQRISSDLHDDIGASLTSINILSQLSQQQKIDTATRNEYLQKINEQTSEVTNALRDIVWSINPKNDKLEIILARMKRYAAELLESKNIEHSFESNIRPEDEITDADIRQNLYLIFKEAVNNLAKYAGATKAVIALHKEAGKITLEVKDNGNGFDPVHVNKGNGIENMQRRARMIDAKFSLVAAPGNGTQVKAVIPL